MRFTKLLTLLLIIILGATAPIKQADAGLWSSLTGTSFGDTAVGSFLGGRTSYNSGGLFSDGGLLGSGGVFSGLGSAIETGVGSFGKAVDGIFGNNGLATNGGFSLDLGGVLGSVVNTPIFGGALGVEITRGGNLDIFNTGANILTGVLSGDSFKDAASSTFKDFARSITTSSPALNTALSTAINGGSISDILKGAGRTALSGITTGNAALDRLIRAAADKIGGTLGGIFGSFGLIGGGCGGAGLGGVICNTVYSNQFVPFLFAGLSYLMGLILAIRAIYKVIEHVERPSQVQIWEPLKTFLAGGAFFALPTVINAVYDTVALGIGSFDGSNFNGEGATGAGLDAMLVALMTDIWTPMNMAFSAFAYIAGIILVMIGISRLLKSEQDGPKGPTGIGTFMTFIVAGALLSYDKMLGATAFSLFNGAEGQNAGALVFTAGMTGNEIEHVNAVINAVTAFVAIIGWISFLRGLFLLRGVAEGNQQATTMAAITHIIGGAIAVNLGPMLEAVQATLGITGMNLGVSFG